MIILYITRLFLGVFLGVTGYTIASLYLPHTQVLFIPNFYQFVITLGCSVYGFFALPFALGAYQQKLILWLFNFVRSIIGDTLQDFYTKINTDFETDAYGNIRRKNRETKERKSENLPNPMIIDTSAIIDGRIGEIIKTGFISGTLIVPQFVIQELQFIADSADELKRGRGRRGLELLHELKKLKQQKDKVSIKIVTNDYEKIKKVDDKLIKLAKTYKASIVTTDFNLNKAASFQSIKILNVNQLTNAIKTMMLPGEIINIKVVQEGKEKNQGVGYLDDGTMVVIENGAEMIEKNINVAVSRVIQTAAGKMIFTDYKKE